MTIGEWVKTRDFWLYISFWISITVFNLLRATRRV